MTKAEIDEILGADLGRALAPDGFAYAKATKWIVREVNDIKQIISWSYTTSGMGFVVTPALGARSEEILSIFKRVSPIKPADEKSRRTLSVDIWRLAGQRSRGEFKVTSQAEAAEAAAAIVRLVRSDAFPFFERCGSVADIDRLFNTDPNSQASRLLSLDNWTRCANALIAARLAGNQRYDGLVDAYRTLLAGFSGGQFLPQFEALVKLLETVD
ncbi:MAG TPA: hypothetical protein VM076_23055 [Gemmatimonadaceae bacterium]|nr:hypothetical protein [Gemmatimonadaceae bacterium]